MATYIPQKAEDAASADGDLLVPIAGVRNDAAASKTTTDGDYTAIATDAAGRVGIADLGGSITVDGTISVSGPVAVTGPLTDAELRASAVPVSVSTLPLPSGAATEAKQDVGNASLSVLDDWDETDRAKVNPIVGQAGVQGDAGASTANTQRVAIATNANTVDMAALVADGSGTFTQETSKVMPAGFIVDDTAGVALAENDPAAARIDTKRAQVMVIEDATTRGRKATVTLAGNQAMDIAAIATTAPTLAGFLNIHGQIAHDTADSANNRPVKVGGQARQTNPAAVTDADVVNLMADDLGRLVITPNQTRDLVSDGTATRTSSTAFADLIAAEASVLNDILAIVFANTSATGTEVQVANSDDTTIRLVFYVPANDVRGIVFQTPLKGSATNAAWRWKTVTSVASVKASFQFAKNV